MYTSKRADSVQPSPTLAITAKAKAMKAQGIDVVGFGAGEPDFDTPDNIKQAAIKSINEGFTKYTPVAGIPELKDAIIKKFQRDNGLTYTRDQIIVSCGAKHTLYNIAQSVYNPGDEVIVPAPYWVSYPDQIKLADAIPVIVNTSEKNNFKMTADELKAKITSKTKALILNSPSNPTGIAYTKNELSKIAEIIVSKKILVVSDEIYEKLVYDGTKHITIASLGKEIKELTIVVNGVSKEYSMTGWRIGYAGGNKDIISAMDKIQSQSTSNPTSISQKAALEALNGPQEKVKEMVVEFDNRRKYIVERLNSIRGVTCPNPNGAFYVFPNVGSYYGKKFKGNKIFNSNQMTDYLLNEAKVAVIPGGEFGADNHIRLSYALSMESIKKGLDRIESALKSLE